MSFATKGKEINLTKLVAAIGSVLNGLCYNEIEQLLGSTKGDKGSISKIKDLLDTITVNIIGYARNLRIL